jgi:hypothetical protein
MSLAEMWSCEARKVNVKQTGQRWVQAQEVATLVIILEQNDVCFSFPREEFCKLYRKILYNVLCMVRSLRNITKT